MLISAFIFVISMAAVIQFVVQSWRSGLMRVASIASTVAAADPASQVYRKILETSDFYEVMGYQKVCQDLQASGSQSLSGVAAYYRVLSAVKALGSQIGLQAASAWSMQEMAMCTRYAAVVMIQRLERNQSTAAEVRSY